MLDEGFSSFTPSTNGDRARFMLPVIIFFRARSSLKVDDAVDVELEEEDEFLEEVELGEDGAASSSSSFRQISSAAMPAKKSGSSRKCGVAIMAPSIKSDVDAGGVGGRLVPFGGRP